MNTESSRNSGKTESNLTIAVTTIARETLGQAVRSVAIAGLVCVVEPDLARTGMGKTRNRVIEKVNSEWVGFLDDDDRITPDYGDRLKQALIKEPDADVVIFKLKRPDDYQGMLPDQILPREERIFEGNVGINFACKTELAKHHPFREDIYHHTDSEFLKTLEKNGAKVYFSPHITYLVRNART